MELQSGRDARFKVDGNYLSRTSNTISDAIGGVTLNLKKAEEGTTITLNVHRDVDGLTGQIKDFVSKYNEVMDFVKAQMTYDTEAQQPGGILFGDGTLRSVKNDLVALLVSPVSGVSSQFSILGQVGISLDKEGTLTVNESTLKGYLQSNFDDVKKLFAAQGTASVGAIRYVGHGRETKPGTYAVQITQAATRAAVTGTVDLSGGLGGDETLAIAVGSASASINLTAGMSLAQIVTAVNSELGRSFSRSIVGDRVLYADALRTTEISSATTWANVYDDTGTSAGIQDGDVIDFSGVNRSGVAVNGSYTITDAGTATVQGLLSAIETAFGNTVTAQINGDGKIVLTDKNDGTSVSSLEIFNPGGRNLNFGTIDIDPTGADGSREGRYALAVSATASADNKYLVLTQNYYGSAHTFTLAQANDLVLGAGLDGSFSGLDVAGTINGEEATGSGQTLTGKIGAANVDGLVISYSGTAMGSIGTLSLTLGTAELFDRSLFHITDGFEGYVAFKKTSIQNNIESLETKISQKEDLLERKMERLALQFQTMERIVSTLKNQSNWLSSQISSLS
jgi:flagellar hook-associated protein 2